MGIRRKLHGPPIEDPWIDGQYIAAKYSVSYRTAVRWITALAQKHLTFTDNRFKKGESAFCGASPCHCSKNTSTNC